MTDSGLREVEVGPASDAAWEALGGIAEPGLSYLSLEDLLGELLERIRRIVRVDTAAILLRDRERDVLLARAAKGIEEEVRQGVRIPLGGGFAGRVAAEARPIAIDDLSRAHVLNPILRQKGISSLLGVPLVTGGRVIGVLHVGSLAPRRFDENDVRLLQMAADRAALAIDNAELSEQRAMTEIMQRHLLPAALPEIPGLRVSAKYLPAPGAGVGGDWYDVFTLADGRIALVIGDVAGRGVGAAAVMAEARTALRAYAMERHGLEQILALLNALIVANGRRRSVSLAIFALDLETDELSAISAGHPPALLVHADGGRELVAYASGPPLGSRLSSGYAVESVRFGTGCGLLLYTDGLIERRHEALDAGLERLQRTAPLEGQESLPLADRIFNRLTVEEGVEDDVAVLAIESFALGERLAMTLEAEPGTLAGLRRVLARWLIEQRVPPSRRFDITLAASEAAANAVEHAYGPRDATFSVVAELVDGDVVVRVADQGSWRQQSRGHRGRGLVLMEALMDEVTVERSADGTTVTMRAPRT